MISREGALELANFFNGWIDKISDEDLITVENWSIVFDMDPRNMGVFVTLRNPNNRFSDDFACAIDQRNIVTIFSTMTEEDKEFFGNALQNVIRKKCDEIRFPKPDLEVEAENVEETEINEEMVMGINFDLLEIENPVEEEEVVSEIIMGFNFNLLD